MRSPRNLRPARQSAQHGVAHGAWSGPRRAAPGATLVALGALSALIFAACGEKTTQNVADAFAPIDAAALAVADASTDAAPEASTSSLTPAANPKSPFGTLKTYEKNVCKALLGGGKHRIAERDLRSYFVDGDDLLALVNRSPMGMLPPDYAPSDLVDLHTQKPVASSQDCDRFQCMRKDASAALADMMGAMAKQGFPGHVESAYRSYFSQCGTFLRWVEKSDGNFCEAAEQSALPGHSQHQLGTTVDLFTEEWNKDPRGVFREGFGCTDAGQWLQKHSFEYGFVMPYPIHPDDRHPKQKCVVRWDINVPINPMTGYRFEHWHYRFIGKENATAYTEAVSKSNPDAPDAPTLEQWLRKKRGLVPDAELPVCDGCECGACSTLADDGPCKADSLKLDDTGLPKVASSAPELKKAVLKKGKHGTQVIVTIAVPESALTQPPVTTAKDALYTDGSDITKLSPYPATAPHHYEALAGAYRIGVRGEGSPPNSYPYQASLAGPKAAVVYNRANILLPAQPGTHTHTIVVPSSLGDSIEVALIVDGKVIAKTNAD